MEAVMIAGVAVVAIGGWYSAIDMFADMGIRIRKRIGGIEKSGSFSRTCRVPSQRSIKQMAGMNI